MRQPHAKFRSSRRRSSGPGSFYTSLMPIFLARGAPEAIQQVNGPVVLVTNLLTEGRGMWHFTAGEAVRQMSEAIGRPIDVALVNTARPSAETLDRYRAEHKQPLELGDIPSSCEVVTRRVLVRRHRPSRSPPPRAGRLGRARPPVVVTDKNVPLSSERHRRTR